MRTYMLIPLSFNCWFFNNVFWSSNQNGCLLNVHFRSTLNKNELSDFIGQRRKSVSILRENARLWNLNHYNKQTLTNDAKIRFLPILLLYYSYIFKDRCVFHWNMIYSYIICINTQHALICQSLESEIHVCSNCQ